MTWSVTSPRRYAARVPSTMLTARLTMIAPIAISMVAGTAVARSLVTGRPVTSDVPRSPRSRFPM
jgi:hypothetical protein